jgi:hypothetical protein
LPLLASTGWRVLTKRTHLMPVLTEEKVRSYGRFFFSWRLDSSF